MSRQLSIRQAAAVQFASKYSNIAVQLVISMVLARLVTPAEFGIVALVTVFTSFFALLSDMGISAGIVQHKELDDADLSGLFLFSVGLAVALAALFALLSIPAGVVYDGLEAGRGQGDLLRSLFLVSSAGMFFSALNTVPDGILRRQKRFLAIGIRLVVVNLVTGCVAIAMAFAGAGCYALVAQFVLSSVLVFLCNFVLSGLRVRRVSVMRPLKAVWGFSSFQFAHGFVTYFCRNLDNLLVGTFFGSAALGFYNKAYRLSTYPVAGFTSVVASVLHPYLSDRQDRPDEIYDRFVRLTQGVFVVGIAVSACLVAAPDETVEVLFGEQWGASAPLLCALAVSVMFQMCTSLTGAIFQSLGATRDMFMSTVVNTAITVVAICLGVASGDLLVLAVLVSASFCVNPIATYYYLVPRAFGRPLGAFARTIAPQLVVAVAMMVVAFVLQWASGPTGTLGTFASVEAFEQVALSVQLGTATQLGVGFFAALAMLLLKVVACLAVYAFLLAVTGQWRHLRVFVGNE